MSDYWDCLLDRRQCLYIPIHAINAIEINRFTNTVKSSLPNILKPCRLICKIVKFIIFLLCVVYVCVCTHALLIFILTLHDNYICLFIIMYEFSTVNILLFAYWLCKSPNIKKKLHGYEVHNLLHLFRPNGRSSLVQSGRHWSFTLGCNYI